MWVKGRRREYHERKLCDSTVKELEAAGFLWGGTRGGAGKPRSSKGAWDCQWEAAFAQLQAYADKHGHCRVKRVYKSAGIGLGRWVRAAAERVSRHTQRPSERVAGGASGRAHGKRMEPER